MKKKWIQPIINTEHFSPNEYVASCWSIECNVLSGVGYYEKNGVPGYQNGEDEFIAQGEGCGTTHTAHGVDAAGPTANAMWQPNPTRSNPNPQPYEVFYFEAKNTSQEWGTQKSDHHFSKVSDAKWESNPNASN